MGRSEEEPGLRRGVSGFTGEASPDPPDAFQQSLTPVPARAPHFFWAPCGFLSIFPQSGWQCVPSRRVVMHFVRLFSRRSTFSVSSMFENHTSRRTAGLRLFSTSLSTKRTPVIISAGSMDPPTIPRMMLFHFSSMGPPPSDAGSWNWKCPPVALVGSSHSGLMPSRKTMRASTMLREPSASRTNFFPSRSSLGCGRWFQYFQKPFTVEKVATRCVASE
mmetsp:Transcript_86267/g.231420  ORF Transcript_86267/g.231420 Transcript_86267/m.231420 type:complete len:219 (-) Transcript_86267:285-941(-)